MRLWLKVGLDIVDSSSMEPKASSVRQGAAFAGSQPAVLAAWLFFAGATIGQLSLLLPRAPHTNEGALELNICLTYLGALCMILVFRRLPVWTFHLVMIAGTGLITRAIYYSGQGVSYYGVWYLWVALFAFSFFKRSQATLHVALAGVAYAAVLSVRHDPIAEARWLTTIASLLIAGVFIDALVRHVRSQHEQAAEDSENLGAVIDAMHRIFSQPSAEATRFDLCDTARSVAHADSAALWEPSPGNQALSLAAHAGETLTPQQLSLETPSGAAHAYKTGRPRHILRDAHQGPALESDTDPRVRSVLWQPVLRGDTTVALLALYWLSPVPAPEQNICATIALLGAQAAAAIERIDLLGRLEGIAHTDELTGLPNRRAWREALPREMARAKREHRPLCVALLDIDGLKKLNDSRGHNAGDQLLKQNAAAWSSALRSVDLLARYGGDEFAAILTGCELSEAQELVARLVAATPKDSSFSVGIAEWDGDRDVQALMAEADEHLYAAKATRGRFVVASS